MRTPSACKPGKGLLGAGFFRKLVKSCRTAARPRNWIVHRNRTPTNHGAEAGQEFASRKRLRQIVHIANIIAEWNQQVAYAQGTTLRGSYEREATNLRARLSFRCHTTSLRRVIDQHRSVTPVSKGSEARWHHQQPPDFMKAMRPSQRTCCL